MYRQSIRFCCRALAVLALVSAPLAAQGRKGEVKAPVHIKTAQELESALAKVDQIFAAEYARDNLASATVGVISGWSLIWTKNYGLADIEKKVAATKDSAYRIGSITKEFTGIMLLQLESQGKVHFSDPVAKYFPEIGKVPNAYPGAPPITLIQLATHTSGLDREPGDMATYTTGPVARWEETLIAALPHLKYAYEPGTRYSYSNIGYGILGATLARAAGEPYVQYVRKHILEPLGMTRSAMEQNDDILRTLAKGYVILSGQANPGPSKAELRDGRGYKVPNGALFTTVEDLARFVSFQMGDGPEAVLSKSVLAESQSRVYSATGDLASAYGIGFMLFRQGDLIVMGHGGSVAGYAAGAYFNPASHIGIIFLRNATGHGFGQIPAVAALEALTAKH